MKLVLNAALLRREMQSKNLDGQALAQAAKVSPGVISNALAGRPVRLRSGTQIVHAIRSAPDVEGIAEHLALDEKKATAPAPRAAHAVKDDTLRGPFYGPLPDKETATSLHAVAVDEEGDEDDHPASAQQ